jgi:Na+/proline symporter
MLQYIFKLAVIPAIVAVIVYIILHVQIKFIHKFIDADSTERSRKRLNLIGSMIAFFGTLCLVILQTILKGQ